MAHELDVIIGGRTYRLATKQGQEDRLKHVASLLDGYVKKLHQSAPSMERDRLLILAGLMLADEHLTLRTEAEERITDITSLCETLAERVEQVAAQL